MSSNNPYVKTSERDKCYADLVFGKRNWQVARAVSLPRH
jgi:hypothetical protein